MSAETPVAQGSEPGRAGWRAWLQVVALAVLLLAVSEALWLWQTWPVRELLYPAPTTTPAAGTR